MIIVDLCGIERLDLTCDLGEKKGRINRAAFYALFHFSVGENWLSVML